MAFQRQPDTTHSLLVVDHASLDTAGVPCLFEADFDDDGHVDTIVWSRRWGSVQPDLEVTWGATGDRSRLAQDRYGQLDAADGFSGCALSTWTLAELVDGGGSIGVLKKGSRVGSIAMPVDGLAITGGAIDIAVFFREGRWENATAQPPAAGSAVLLPSSPSPEQLSCSAAVRARRAHIEAKASIYDVETGRIAASSCDGSGDFDGDGRRDRMMWGASADSTKAGLFVEWGSGAWSVLGAGNTTAISVPSGHTGCSGPQVHLNGYVDATVVSATAAEALIDAALPRDRDFVLLTTWMGVQELVYFDDGWVKIVVPLDWGNKTVVLPDHESWLPLQAPFRELWKYRHVVPPRRIVLEHHGPLPPVPPASVAGRIVNEYELAHSI